MSVEDKTYNGWANRETWSVGLWGFNDDESGPITEEWFCELVNGPTEGILGEIFNSFVSSVDWEELKEHWEADHPAEEEEEEEEEV